MRLLGDPWPSKTPSRGCSEGGAAFGSPKVETADPGLPGRGAAFCPSLSPNPSRAGRAGVAGGAAVQEPGQGGGLPGVPGRLADALVDGAPRACDKCRSLPGDLSHRILWGETLRRWA